MILKRIEISNLRNIESLSFDPTPGLNLISGENGVGKTALLEGLHLLVRGRSFRTTLTDSLIRRGESFVLLRSLVSGGDREVQLAVLKESQKSIRMKFDNSQVKQLSQVAKAIPAQLLNPNIAELIFGPPRFRREWLDWGAFHQYPDFLGHIHQWRRSLDQRNAALRQRDVNAVKVWSATVGEHGDRITELRTKYVNKIQEWFSECLAQLDPTLNIQLSISKGFSGKGLEEDLNRNIEKDLQSGVTQIGPQRADVRLRLVDYPVAGSSTTASQVLSRGQGKIAACAMRVAESQLLNTLNKKTIFFIDDIDAELDESYSSKLVRILLRTGGQVFATTTTPLSHLTYLKSIRDERITVFQMSKNSLQLLKL